VEDVELVDRAGYAGLGGFGNFCCSCRLEFHDVVDRIVASED
jgi:hypothetical protein